MIRLLMKYLKPYTWLVVGVVVLQLVQSVASLFLPTLNARIIDDGVATGNTDLIWQLGLVMLGVSLIQIAGQIGATWFGARSSMAFGRDLRSSIFDSALSFSSREVSKFGAPSLITRNTNDVQQLQQMVLMTAIMIVAAPLTMIGGIVMALREDVGLSWLIVVAVVLLAVIIGVAGHPDDPAVQGDADQDRHPEPGAARADLRPAGDPRVRPRAHGGRAVRPGQLRPHRHRHPSRPAHDDDVPCRHVRDEPLLCRRDVVRLLPRRSRRACRWDS